MAVFVCVLSDLVWLFDAGCAPLFLNRENSGIAPWDDYAPCLASQTGMVFRSDVCVKKGMVESTVEVS